MGIIGLVLLVVSGIVLIIPYWSAILLMPLLILKLVLISILIVLIIFITIISRKSEVGNPKTLEMLGKMALVITIGIVIVAVLIFH